MIHIQIRPYFRKHDLTDLLKSVAEATLRMENKVGSLTVVVTGDKEIRSMNQVYRQLDASTDVLSFPAQEIDPETGTLYLGDIIISYPYAKKQADAEKHSVHDELSLLVVHGVLHLLDYDHMNKKDRKVMWNRQAEILDSIGISSSVFHPFGGVIWLFDS